MSIAVNLINLIMKLKGRFVESPSFVKLKLYPADQADGLLMGRKIYQLMESAWPAIAISGEGPQFMVDFAHKLDRKPKYVFSRTLDQLSWQG